TDDNTSDFQIISPSDPQNLSSPPAATPSLTNTPSATPTVTDIPTQTPTATRINTKTPTLTPTDTPTPVSGVYGPVWYTVDGGGGMFSEGGDFSEGGTVGQHDAGSMAGGDFEVNGGFWPG